MWERLLKIRPRLIVLVSRTSVDKKLFQIALDNGYEIEERDLKRNKAFRKSKFVMEKAIEKDPSFIKYYESSYFLDWDKLTSKARDYQPTIQDLKKNPFMGYSKDIVEKIINEETVNQITIDDIKKNSALARNEMVFRHLISINPNYITRYEGLNQELFELAISANNGYQPNISDLDDNHGLCYSDAIMERLITETQDGNLIFKYYGNNEHIFELAISLGIDEERMIKSIKNETDFEHYNFRYSKAIMMKIIEKDSSLIEHYRGRDIEVFEYAFEKDYIPTENFFRNNKNDKEILRLMIIIKPELINILYNEDPFYHNIELLTLAVKNGYIPTEEEMIRHKMDNNKLIPLLIEKKPEFIKYYTGTDIEIIKTALRQRQVPSVDTFNEIIDKPEYEDLIISIVRLRPDYLENITDQDTLLFIRILAFDYIPSMEEVKNNYRVNNNLIIMKKLIMHDPNYIICCGHSIKDKIELYEIAIENGYNIDELLVDEEENRIIYKSDKIMRILIQTRDINYIKKYEGTNIEIFKLVVGKYIVKQVHLSDYSHSIENENNAIISLLSNNNFETIIKNEALISTNYKRLFKIAIEMGYVPQIKNINKYNKSFLNENILRQIIDNSTINDCIDLISRINDLGEDIEEYILKSKNIDMPIDYLTLLINYQSDKLLFINNYPKFTNFLKELEIDETKFTQFAFLSSHDWLTDILTIADNGKTAEFQKVEKYFFENYYFKGNNINEATKIKSFVNILKNYNKYPELCLDIANQNNNLTDEIIEKIDFLFSTNEVLDEKDRPKSINDLNNLQNVFSNNFLSEIKNIDKKSIEEIKDIICKQLFNEDLVKIKTLLSTYGNTEDLRQLLFDNKENIELHDIISEMMIYTSMIESIVETTDKKNLIDMVKRIADNFELTTRCMMIFTRFDEKMQELYSEELSTNLTMLRDDISLDSLIDRKMTEECGVEVLDFSDRQYCLLAHVKSSNETEEEIILGKSSNSSNFISLSAISHRNQVYYAYDESSDIVFGYDSLPDGAFMQSSVSNMGTNGLIRNNSLEVSQGYRQQRGILKTSTAPEGNNSEVLSIREGTRPKYIILPGGRKPREKEISLAKRYGLKFVKTQEIRKAIDNPQKIEPEYKKPKDSDIKPKDMQGIREIRSTLIPTNHGPRKIAIFTDSHALFEPTLAILEDARKNGITEIYSLGDNIGTGPNPREVLELLDEYGVESLSGNHEIYATLGIEDSRVKEHLKQTGATEEARRNSTWTKAQLTQEQIERIKNNPEQRVIEIGGQKVLLTHFAYDYNTHHKLQIPDGVTHTFQGHIHFEGESKDKDITTLRGAGIGAKADESGQAYYLILVEKPDGGFDIERHVIAYDRSSLGYDIKSSDMPSQDKRKIENWAGVRR